MNIAVTYLIKDNKVLLLYKDMRGYYVAPGGKIEENETVIAAAKREFLEETGLQVNPALTSISTITTQNEQHETKSLYNMFTFVATDYEGTLIESVKEGQNAWYDLNEIEALPMFLGDKILLNRILEKLEEYQEEIPMDYASFCYDGGYKELYSYEILI